MKHTPPFNINASFYDGNDTELEWVYWWGDCPDAARVEWYVEDLGTYIPDSSDCLKA